MKNLSPRICTLLNWELGAKHLSNVCPPGLPCPSETLCGWCPVPRICLALGDIACAIWRLKVMLGAFRVVGRKDPKCTKQSKIHQLFSSNCDWLTCWLKRARVAEDAPECQACPEAILAAQQGSHERPARCKGLPPHLLCWQLQQFVHCAEKMPLFYLPKRASSSPHQLSNQVWDPESRGGGQALHTQICSRQPPYKEGPWDRRRRTPKGRLGRRRGSPESEEKQWWGHLGWGRG